MKGVCVQERNVSPLPHKVQIKVKLIACECEVAGDNN